MAGRRRIPHRVPLVAAQVRRLLAELVPAAEIRGLMLQVMARPGRVLSPSGPTRWPAIVQQVCSSLGGSQESWVMAATAVEFAVAAIDVVDDVIDDEWCEQLAPLERAVNVSQALSWLSQRCACDLEATVGPHHAQTAVRLLSEGCLRCCAGQDLDLVLEAATGVGEDDAFRTTEMKSGALVAMACQVGGAAAGADATILGLLAWLGSHVGVVEQLLNDIADIDPRRPELGSDLRRKKKTLPIAFALRCAREEGVSPLVLRLESREEIDVETEKRLADEMLDLGALNYAWAVAQVHRDMALDMVDRLVRATERPEVAILASMVPKLGGHRSGR